MTAELMGLEQAATERALAIAARAADGDPDANLVNAARAGSRTAFDELVSRHARKLFRTIQSITRNLEDSEDALQNAFTQAYTHLASFHGDSRFSTWLTRIAINQALMTLRRRRAGHFSLDELDESEDGSLPREIVDWAPSPERRFSQVELRAILQKALARLSPAKRIVFQLREVEEFSVQETAKALNVSIIAVKSRLHRARLELREILNQHFRAPRQSRVAHA